MVAERFDEWIDFPPPAQLKRHDAYFVQLVSKLRRVSDRVQAAETAVIAAQADVDALEAVTLALSDGTSSITFATNIANFGAGYQALRCVKTRDDVVHVSGLIQNNTGGAVADGSVIAQLPTGWRPATIFLGQGLRAAGSARYDIATNGQISIKQFAWPDADFLSIEVTFEAA